MGRRAGAVPLGRCGSRRETRREAALNRGAVYDAELPAGPHPVVIVTRDTAIPILNQIVVALVTGIVRGLPTEVPLGPEQGLARECVVNCDNLFTIPKQALGRRRGTLGPAETARLDEALRIALGL